MKKFIARIIILLLSMGFSCQPILGQQYHQLSLLEFLTIVKHFHPMAESYQTDQEIARAEVQKARGQVDPVLSAKTGTKTIDQVDYYEESNVHLRIPTWYGVAFEGSFNHIEGQKLNNSDTRGGLYQFGVTVPLARNLIYNQQRAILDQAQAALKMTQAEQVMLTNALLAEAESVYWQWAKSYESLTLLSEAAKVNQLRIEMVRKSHLYGESAAIDTTEALTQLQTYRLREQQAYLDFVKSTQELQLFLWTENQEIRKLNEWTVPSDRLSDYNLVDLYPGLLADVEEQLIDAHASLRVYLQKQDILTSEQRLKRQALLPKIDFTYNFLNKQHYKTDIFPLFLNNYQYGVKLEIPIFLRQARADYRITRHKLAQNQLDIDFKRQEILTKIENYKNDIVNYQQQLQTMTLAAANQQKLLSAEETKYSNGESSLFLINTRENSLIEIREKEIETKLKAVRSYSQLKWLNESFLSQDSSASPRSDQE
ncbi:TolC family protein [Sphingobacterium gobiense]|uniref:Transporter n=1 Tax=Sphingobacterium gobiense TaxID=1382456 RepID=A0A2S9JNB1_9SPHI|nr:TolC family protein [Sphingobacterium gobiense]PRD54647.1 hypothetical protein C5749_14510 [Sphingobacterium gobiense]